MRAHPLKRVGAIILGLVVMAMVALPAGRAEAAAKPGGTDATVVATPFVPVAYERIDPNGDPRGGSPVYITGQDFAVRTHVRDVSKVVALVTRGVTITDAAASGIPDAAGDVQIALHLPIPGQIYVIQGYAVVAGHGQQPSGNAHPALVWLSGFRVLAPAPLAIGDAGAGGAAGSAAVPLALLLVLGWLLTVRLGRPALVWLPVRQRSRAPVGSIDGRRDCRASEAW